MINDPEKLKEFDKVQILYQALMNIGHIGCVMDAETGQTFECNPIEVAQIAINNFNKKED